MKNIDFKKQNVPFTQVANDVLNNKKLSLQAKGLYAYLHSKPEGWDFNYIRIANDMAESKNTILKYLQELEDQELLNRKRLSTGRMEYIVLLPNTKLWSEDNEPNTKKATDQTLVRPNFGHISNKENNIVIKNNTNKEIQGIEHSWLNIEIWNKWIAYRSEIKKKLTPISMKQQLVLLEKHKEDHVKIIEQSIQNGWTGLFPVKNTYQNNSKKMYVI